MTPSEAQDPKLEHDKSANKAKDYERLRAWYLAHLRKSQLVGDIAGDVTPATLIKRDREALEKLISETAPAVQAERASNKAVGPKPERPYQKTTLMLGVANAAAAIWLVCGLFPLLSTDFPQRLAVATLLVLSLIFVVLLSKALQQAQNKYQAVTLREQVIADYAYEAFWSIDDNFDFIAINLAGERLLGTRYQFMNKSFYAAVPKGEHTRIAQFFAKAKQLKQTQKFETQMLKNDGSTVDVELSAEYSVSDLNFYCVAMDISGRKEVERIKEQLMAMLSHDLKTPLSSLKFSLALLSSPEYGQLSREGENVRRIGENNVERLIQLINQLLDLHKLDAHQLKLTLKDVPVSEIIRPALEAIESIAEQKNIEVVIKAEEITVCADKDRMLQVLINLISNAIKYSPPNTQIVLAVKKLQGEWLAEFRVSDAGPGIAKEHRQLVFDRFYRIVSEDGKTEEGTGLGLAICKAIVEAHGGKIDVENNQPRGSSFFCHIPAVKDRKTAERR